MSICAVTFANYDSARYTKNLARLSEMWAIHCKDVPLLGFTDFAQIGSPHHTELKYGFKTYAIQRAIDMGYRKIIWLDSAVYPIQSIDKFIEKLNREGLVLFDNPHLPFGEWVSDVCLQHYAMDREWAKQQKQLTTCLFAFDIEKENGMQFWCEFQAGCLNPKLANGSWTNNALQISKDALVRGHRHDQSIATAIALKNGYEFTDPMQTFFAYKEWYKRFKIADTVCFNSASF
jgi:hypothetical protein